MKMLANAKCVANHARLDFLPMLFGDDFVLAEQHMFNYAQRFCCDYDGGFWQFYTLPNGGGYMAPNAERVVFSSLNGFEAEISGDAAGMILTALVLNHRCWLHHEQGDDELAEHFILRAEQLRSAIDDHPESHAIWLALD